MAQPNQDEDFFDYRRRVCTEAFTFIESLKRGIIFYVESLEYTYSEALKVRKIHKQTYKQLKNEGWKTCDIKSVAECTD